ncbi:hypothetical protein [Dyadobacter sp.]|uniref:hypothetical protein n=1 Tax=Dyadobacter sp. TaxID=1914288 RepID=UPI003F706FCF
MESQIYTIGRDGEEYKFNVEYSLKEKPLLGTDEGVWPKHCFEIFDSNLKAGSYQFTVIELNESIRIIELAHNDHIHLKGKRIGARMITYVQEMFNKAVTSSSNKPGEMVDDPEFRSTEATRFWDELVASQLASYNDKKDIYIYNYFT